LQLSISANKPHVSVATPAANGVALGLVKTAVDAAADPLIVREAQWLRELGEVPSLEGQVPRLLDEGTSAHGRRYLVMSIAPAKGIDAGETRAFTPEHARFLASLGKARFRTADFEVSACCQLLARELHELRGAASRVAMATLEEAFHDCETALLYWTGPYVVSQGDFTPWNIRRSGSQLFVADWGAARAEASPLDDVLHYLMVQRALCTRRVSVRCLQAAMKRAHEFALQAYPEWCWRERVIGALTLVYLLGAIVRQTYPVASAYWRLIEKRSRWLPN
jgi:Phosphotransferase enzyme family